MVLNWYDPYKDDDAYYSDDDDKDGFYLALENAGIIRKKFRRTSKPEIVTGKRGGKYVKSKSGKLRSIMNTTNSVSTGKTNIYGRKIYISKKNKPFVFNRWGLIPITKIKTEYPKKPLYKILNGPYGTMGRSILQGPRGGKIQAYVEQSNGNYVKKGNFIKLHAIRNIKSSNKNTGMTTRSGKRVYENKKGRKFMINSEGRRKAVSNYQLLKNEITGKFTSKGQPIIKSRDGSLYYTANSGTKSYIYTSNMFKEAGKTPTGKQLYTSGFGNLFYIGNTGRKHHIYQNSHLNQETQFRNASGRKIYSQPDIGKTYVLTKNGKISYKWRFPKQNTNKLPLNVINKIIKLTE